MDYKTALVKLDALRSAIEQQMADHSPSKERYANICMLYGEVEEVVHRFGGVSKIEVPNNFSKAPTYPNFIEAGFLSGRTIHQHEGYSQLLKIIGKVKQAATDPYTPPAPPSVTDLSQMLRRFRECCQYVQPPRDERGVQDILWIMLRSRYDRVDREDVLPRFGAKAYRPDFGIPDLQILVEVKFVGPNTNVGSIQEEILADVPGYLNDVKRFSGIVELLYDDAHKLRDPRKFIEDLRTVDGIIDVIVVPGISG